jgi:hypothetical protein
VGDFRSRDNMGFSDSLEGVDTESIAFAHLHHLGIIST